MNPYMPNHSAYIGPSYGPPEVASNSNLSYGSFISNFSSFPCYDGAFQDAAVPTPAPAPSSSGGEKEKKKNLRMGGGKVWEDPTLAEWPEDDYRVFVGDLGNEVTDDVLYKAFAHYSSLNKARVVRDKITTKSKGFGFVSLSDPVEFLKALKEMNGVYIGNRPCKVKKSDWKKRDLNSRVKASGKQYVNQLVTVQTKGAASKLKKRKPRPENANRDELRKKSKPEPNNKPAPFY